MTLAMQMIALRLTWMLLLKLPQAHLNYPPMLQKEGQCQIPKFYKVIEVTRFGTVIRRVRSQGKGIASLDGSNGDAASTYGLRPLRVSLPKFHGRSDLE